MALGLCILIVATARGQESVGRAQQSASAEQAMRQALQKKSDFDFKETPLSDVIKALKDLTKLEIMLDMKALQEINVSSDTPITLSVHGISARSALRLLLREHGLTWLVRDEVLLVTTPEEAEINLETRVYPVQDLITPKPCYRFEGMYVPGMSSGFPRAVPPRRGSGISGMGGSMTGSMGGMGGGMGGGMFAVSEHAEPDKAADGPSANPPPAQPPKEPPKRGGGGGTTGGSAAEPAQPPAPSQPAGLPVPRPNQPAEAYMGLDMNDLVDLIKETVKPTSWDDTGGAGSISPAAGLLVVSQIQEVHEEIETLLENLRAVNPQSRVVTIRATWLLLDLKQLNQLLSSKPGKEGGIDRKALEEMAAKAKGYLGTITCFSGQTAHVASGRSRSVVTGAIPVVGGAEGVGYQPIINNPNSSAVLQVTPQLLPHTQTAILDICSSVTRLEAPAESIRFLAGEPAGATKEGEGKSPTTITLDRVNVIVGQLATTLKVTLGEPTLVGGLTRELAVNSPDDAAGVPQLYLFVEATAK